MATIHSFATNATAGALSTAVDSTKIRFYSNVACYVATGNTSPIVITSNAEIIPSNTVRYIIMGGVGNKINVVSLSGPGLVSVVGCGAVDSARVVNY